MLVAAFRRTRDERAFRALYRRHTPSLYAMAVRLTGGHEPDAEDIVQDTWIRAVDALDRFGWRSSLRTWLIGIAVNCHRERCRRDAGLVPFDARDVPDRRSDSPARAGTRIDLERAIAALADGYREVLVLFDIEGYTHREIATLLRIQEGTCKSQLSRARRALRQALADSALPEPRPEERQRESTRHRRTQPD